MYSFLAFCRLTRSRQSGPGLTVASRRVDRIGGRGLRVHSVRRRCRTGRASAWGRGRGCAVHCSERCRRRRGCGGVCRGCRERTRLRGGGTGCDDTGGRRRIGYGTRCGRARRTCTARWGGSRLGARSDCRKHRAGDGEARDGKKRAPVPVKRLWLFHVRSSHVSRAQWARTSIIENVKRGVPVSLSSVKPRKKKRPQRLCCGRLLQSGPD